MAAAQQSIVAAGTPRPLPQLPPPWPPPPSRATVDWGHATAAACHAGAAPQHAQHSAALAPGTERRWWGRRHPYYLPLHPASAAPALLPTPLPSPALDQLLLGSLLLPLEQCQPGGPAKHTRHTPAQPGAATLPARQAPGMRVGCEQGGSWKTQTDIRAAVKSRVPAQAVSQEASHSRACRAQQCQPAQQESGSLT